MTTINPVNTSLAGQTGTGQFVGSSSPNFSTPNLGTPNSGVLTNMTGTQKGTTTNDNAAAGQVGEFISSVVPAASIIAVTNNVVSNVTTISLSAGDWNVWGNIFFSGSNNLTTAAGWISLTSATPPDASLYNTLSTNSPFSSFGVQVPSLRFSLATTTTIYLSCISSFASSIVGVLGGIYARRAR